MSDFDQRQVDAADGFMRDKTLMLFLLPVCGWKTEGVGLCCVFKHSQHKPTGVRVTYKSVQFIN